MKMKNDFPRLIVSPEIRRKMIEVARQFRKEPTRSEAMLWQALRGKKLDGIKFRRQQPIGNFVVDFYNSVYRLVVEVDGSVHDSQIELDRERQTILEQLGLNVLRVKSEDVEKNLSSVLETIRSKINELKMKTSKSPSPLVGEGLGERLEEE
ncbi:MAG: endonuclease domain-containing protein [Chloroflexota bacterium]